MAKKQMETRWLSVEEIAEYLGVVPHSIYRWIAQKRIPAHRIGKLWKLRKDEVDRWILEGRSSAGPKTPGEAVNESRTKSVDLLEAKRKQILQIAARHGAGNVRVFGSFARGEADEASDVDFLVDLEEGRSLLDLGGLLMDLRALLGRDVDVITERSLNARIRDRVLREALPL